MPPSVSSIIARALRSVPPPPSSSAMVHLALSGGVDSSVAAYLLKERGWRILPIFMRCWTADDAGGGGCVERELRAAQAAAKALALQEPLQDWDFVRDYWHSVFEPVLLCGLAAGLTPNPDVACNARVKFGAFPSRIRDKGGHHFATGHYARLDDRGRLLRAADAVKDQTYFLAHCAAKELQGAIFPVGSLLKSETRAIARHLELPSAHAPSSKGLCFVGARRLSDLVDQYLPAEGTADVRRKARFLDVDSGGAAVAEMPRPSWAYTVGQRARIGGAPEAWYVAGKAANGDVLVTRGAHSPQLYTRALTCTKAHWIGDAPRDGMALHAKLNSCGALEPCRIEATESDAVRIVFTNEVRRIGGGQLIALYHGEQCLGGCLVSSQDDADDTYSAGLRDEDGGEGVFG